MKEEKRNIWKNNDLTFEMILTINNSDLLELGVKELKPRKEILGLIDTYKKYKNKNEINLLIYKLIESFIIKLPMFIGAIMLILGSFFPIINEINFNSWQYLFGNVDTSHFDSNKGFWIFSRSLFYIVIFFFSIIPSLIAEGLYQKYKNYAFKVLKILLFLIPVIAALYLLVSQYSIIRDSSISLSLGGYLYLFGSWLMIFPFALLFNNEGDYLVKYKLIAFTEIDFQEYSDESLKNLKKRILEYSIDNKG